jgi:farnesol dehydrogenase
MKVLVSGVTGFLGGRIAARLATSGHAVRGFVREPARWTPRPEGTEVAVGDVTDAAAFRKAAEGCDVIVHAAALVKVWVKDAAQFDRVNVGGFSNALEASRATGARLVYVSSFFALGPTDGTEFDEETPHPALGPFNDYERTKLAADRLAREAAAAGLPVVRLYPGVIYGPGALTEGNHVVLTLLQHARGKLPGMLGPGDRRWCFAYVEDVAEGAVTAAARAAPGSAYLLGGDNRTLNDLFALFARETGIAPPRIRIPYGVASGIGRLQRLGAEWFGIAPQLTEREVAIYRHEWAYRSERAVRELGYVARPLEDGVARTVAWLRETGALPGS